jgi:acylglycerol lipase
VGVHFVTRAFLAGLAVALTASTLLRTRPAVRGRHREPGLEADHLVVGDGTRLPLAAWLPEGETEAVMLAVHAYGDYRQAFRLLGPWFAARGFAVYAYDQRGFGESPSRGHWPGAEALVQDLQDGVVALRRHHPGLPLVVVGESMGGAVALTGLGRATIEGVDALIVAAPGVRGNMPLRQVHDVALKLAALALPWLAVELRRGGRPWLDPGEAQRLADDPLILRAINVGTYDGLIELATLASETPKTPLPPTLVLHGALDRTVPRRAIDDLMPRLGEGAMLRPYPDRHHLLFHEHEVESVLADCLAWLTGGQALGG